ncbi:Na+/H+ antiporter NhaA [Diaminobutyricimonas sp. TR449]|uniref:Na+/H+ antiporter NhaA n=1 Tax=Diaminobutyricimonas sp. TR449 TaxID=2708076 RepID=UPI00141FF534|nr:Na+/H+ antiporter NhaA [Diaminobutyricimonas sp. TR449]
MTSSPDASYSRFRESLRIEDILRKETVGGIILLVAAALALIFANSGLADAYYALRDLHVGFVVGDWQWEISLGHLAADGLLAIFFFLVGLELKRELVAGELRNPRAALVPVVAAFGGVLVPALIFLALNAPSGGEAQRGWAIPVATDIAFALAVLAVVGTWLPAAMRTFLLTLAVVDDLIGITIIAIFYATDLQPAYLIAALLGVLIFGVIAQKYAVLFHVRSSAAWFILLPIGIVVWALMYQSGVHATVAGVLLALTVPVKRSRRVQEAARARGHQDAENGPGLAELFEHRFRPISTGVAVPVFAFFSAGVTIGGIEGFLAALTSTVTLGIIVALVAGKTIGIVGATWLVTRFRGVSIGRGMAWVDVLGLAVLGGMGFTVSLLIAELSFGISGVLADNAKIGVLVGSGVAAIIAAILLGARNRRYRQLRAEEKVDADRDGIPDVFETP